jgi:RNA-directed DNA polymerase
MSAKAAKSIRKVVKKDWNLKSRVELSIYELAARFNPVIRGWISYYSRFHGSSLYSGVFDYINTTLIRWAMRKHKHLQRRPTLAGDWLRKMQLMNPNLFCHWRFRAVKTT